MLILLFLVSILFNVTGLRWALPSESRSHFYPQSMEWYEISKGNGRLYMISPYEPYHPDESFLLDAMSNMNPGNLDFNPHFFNYPSLSIYLTGALMKVGEIVGYINIVNSKEFYIAHPEQMARIYLLGRFLAAFMSAMTVLWLYLTAKVMFDLPTGFFSALSLAIMPLWVRNSHFMLVNVPSAMWMTGAALLAVIAIKHDSLKALLLSAFLAGLAASTKYPAGFIILLTLFAWLKRYGLKKESFNLAFTLVGVSIVGFVGGTPYMLISPEEFLQGLLFEGGTKLGIPSLPYLLSLLTVSQGTLLCLLTVSGLVIAIAKWRTWQYQFVLLWVMASMVQRVISDADLARYLIPALPALAVCAGIGINAIREQVVMALKLPNRSALGWGVGLLLLMPTIGYSVDMVRLMLGDDIRTHAASWLAEHVPPNQVVGIYDNIRYDGIPIDAESYQLINLNELDVPASPPVIVFTSETEKYWNVDLPSSYTGKTFSQRPSSIWTWPIQERPHDWAYTFIDLYIYQDPNRELGVGSRE
ncbi:MAG: ArnT family glycosyltransferase [Ardenticatenaceae bacterium]